MQPSFQAVGRMPFVRPRLEFDHPRSPVLPFSWDALRLTVEDFLRQLGEDLRAREPSIVAKIGSTKGGIIERFVFASLSMPERPNSEAVVVGVTVERTREGLTLSADVCGDDSGRIYLELPPLKVGEPGPGLIIAAASLAGRLCREPDRIVDAVRQSPEV